MKQIAIVEDNTQYLEVLRSIIISTGENTCDQIFTDAERFIEKYDTIGELDIIFIDIQLPNMSGIELINHIRKKNTTIKIIICSSYDDDDKLFQSLKNGANGYILKSSSPQDILTAIQDVLEGGAPMTQSIAKKVISYFYIKQDNKEFLDLLTVREKEILKLLSQGLLYKEIADKLDCSVETIKKHCGNIYRKLNVNNRTEALNVFFNH